MDEKLAKPLAISDDQKKAIQEEARAMQADLDAEIKKLREKFRRRAIRDVLEDEQLQKLEQMTGEEYDVQDSNIRRFSFEGIRQ